VFYTPNKTKQTKKRSLNDNQLTGIIPPELGNLNNPKSL